MQRIERAETLMLEEVDGVPMDTADILTKIVEEFGISRRTAYDDLAEVWHRRATSNRLAHEARVAEAERSWRRRERLADKRGDTQAGNFALDRLHKLHGLYAAKKVEHSGMVGMRMEIDVRLDAMIGVLDATGRAALDVVLAQLEQARAAGLLPEPTDDEPGEQGEDERPEQQPAPAPQQRPRKKP